MSDTINRGKLSDEWLVDFAAGNLSPAFSALVDSFLDLNADARAKAARLEAVGGEVLDALAPREGLAIDAEMLLDRAGLEKAEEPGTAPCPDFIPPSLREAFGLEQKEIRWSFLGPGLRKALLWKGGNDERLWLLKAQPGVSIPPHTHRGTELTLVLKGAFCDGDDLFAKGDVEEADPSMMHTIEIQDGEECICLAATTGKLVFPAAHIKLFQAFVGI